MNIEQVMVSGAVSLALIVIAFFLRESVTQLIKKFFSTLSDGQVKAIYLLAMTLLVLVPFVKPDLFSFSPNSAPVTVEAESKTSMSKEDLIAKGIDVAQDITQDAFERKRIKDSTLLANKPEKWVYKIGVSSERKNLEFYKMYEVLKSSSNIYAFKEAKKSYFLIKDDNLAYDELVDGINNFKASLPMGISRVEIINLMDYCKLKESIIATDMLTWRKAKTEVPCLTCGK